MRSTTLSFLGFLTFAIVSACGGASNTDLGSGGGGGGSGSSSGGGHNTIDAGVDTGSSQPDTGAPDVSPIEDSGPVQDAPAVVDVAPPQETGPTGPSVLCPMQGQPAMCNPGDVCCVTGNPTTGTQTDTCQAQGQTCSGGTTVHCASTADCPSNYVCCGLKDTAGTMYTEVSCRQQCNGMGQITFCDPSAMDCPQTAPTCVQSQLLQGFSVCQ